MADNVTKLRRANEIESGPSLANLRHEAQKTERKANLILRFGVGLSLIWALICLFYVHEHLGWDFAVQLLPHEMGMLFAGFALPVAMFWAGISSFRRSHDVRFHTEMLRRHLDLLGYPAEEHEGRVKTVSDLLKKQAEELTQVSEYATQHMSKLVEAMETQTLGLGQASDKAAAG